MLDDNVMEYSTLLNILLYQSKKATMSGYLNRCNNLENIVTDSIWIHRR